MESKRDKPYYAEFAGRGRLTELSNAEEQMPASAASGAEASHGIEDHIIRMDAAAQAAYISSQVGQSGAGLWPCGRRELQTETVCSRISDYRPGYLFHFLHGALSENVL